MYMEVIVVRFLNRVMLAGLCICIGGSSLYMSWSRKNGTAIAQATESANNSTASTSDVCTYTPTHVTDFGHAQKWAKHIMQEMHIPNPHRIAIKPTDGVSHATDKQMQINTNSWFGLWDFVVAHEAAHIALGHPNTPDIDEMSRTQEVQADLYAYECLYRLGRKDLIFERLAHITYVLENNWYEPDLGDHPSLRFMEAYTRGFLEDKGEQTSQYIAQRLAYYNQSNDLKSA